MGYLPPSPPTHVVMDRRTFELIRTSFIEKFGGRAVGIPRTFEQYEAQLYGSRGFDWFPVLNYGLLASVIALALWVLIVVAQP